MFSRDKSLKKSLQGKCSYAEVSTVTFTDHFKALNSSSVILPTGMTKSDCLKRQSLSLPGKISFVVANAGIHRKDEVFAYAGDGKAPEKPDLATIIINLIGTLYTSKLASHYFIKQNGQQPSESQEDTCLVLIGSGAAFLDCPRAPQYCATKWAMRGIMHSLRRTAYFYGSRVNVISPW